MESFPSHQHQNVQTLGKMISFIEYHDISEDQLWGLAPYFNVQEFKMNLQEKFGYELSDKEASALESLAGSGGNLYVENFHTLGLWKNQAHLLSYRKNKKQHTSQIRPHTAQNFNNLSNSMATGSKYSRVLKHSYSRADDLSKNSRFKQAQEVLEKKIVENALDKKWEYLIKVGEMNSWGKNFEASQAASLFEKTSGKENLISKKCNRVFKIEGKDDDIQIMEENENGFVENLPLKVFDQKYQSMKKKCTLEEKNKNNMKGTMLLVLDKSEKVTKGKLGEKISQRDQELNYMLLEVMRLKNIFEQQDALLNECGVNG